MSLIAPGIIEVQAGKANAFLIDGDDGLTLVDGGATSTVPKVLAAIAELGGKLTRIVLTHAHPDHVQAAPELRERTGAAVFAHSSDAAWLAGGRVPAEGRSGTGARNFDRLGAAHWTPFEPDQTVADDELIGGILRVIHTPGHSPGHIALRHEPTGALLVGDAVFHTGKLGLGPAGFAAEPDARAGGAARIPHDVTSVGFGHGAALTGADVEGFVDFLRKCQRARVA